MSEQKAQQISLSASRRCCRFSPGEKKVIDSVMIESIYLYTIIVNLSAIKAWLSPVFP